MATKPFAVESFGPLNLTADPEEVGAAGAVDMLDVDLDQHGRVRCRAGYAKFTPLSLAARIKSVATVPYGNRVLAWTDSGPGTFCEITSAGTIATTFTPASNSAIPMFLEFYTSAVATTNTALGHVIVWDSGTGWSEVNLTASVAQADVWSVIARTPVSGRAILTGGLSNRDRVTFGDPGTFSFTADNWEELSAGDGDPITGAAVYREYTLVFKQTKFFAFSGESRDADGGAVFNYRPVDTGIGLAARFGVAAAPEGIYFLGFDGVYITTGDAPRKVSGALDPLFRGDPNAAYSGAAISQAYISQAVMAYYRERVYVAVTTGAATANDRLLVYDTRTGDWLVWSIPATTLATYHPSTSDETLLFGYAAGTNDIGQHFRSYTTDGGSAIAWQYSSGLYDPSGENRVASTLESALWGSGAVTLKVANDHGAFDIGSTVTLGTSPAVAQGWQQIDREGTFWQHKLSGSGPATVSRLVHYISSVKPTGIA